MQNNILYWAGFLLMGGIIGWLAGLIVKGRGFGIVGDIVIGIVGALVGGWLFGMMGLVSYGLAGSFIMALIGAVVIVVLTRFIKRTA